MPLKKELKETRIRFRGQPPVRVLKIFDDRGATIPVVQVEQVARELARRVPGSVVEIRILDRDRPGATASGWYTVGRAADVDDLHEQLHHLMEDYYGVVQEWDSSSIQEVAFMIFPPPAGAAGPAADCLWQAVIKATHKHRFNNVEWRDAEGATHGVIDDYSLRAFLGVGPGPIEASEQVLAGVDKLVGSQHALQLRDASGLVIWASPKRPRAAVTVDLQIVPTDSGESHYQPFTETLGFQRATGNRFLTAVMRYVKLRKLPPRPVQVFLPGELREREHATQPDSAPYVAVLAKPGETREGAAQRFEAECKSLEDLYPKIAAGKRGAHAYRLTGDARVATLVHLSAGQKGMPEPPEPIGQQEALWVRMALACSYTYWEACEDAQAYGYDANSCYPSQLVRKVQLPTSAGKFQTLAAPPAASWRMGIYRLERAPLFELLSNSQKPLRRFVRGLSSYSVRYGLTARISGDEFWTSADINRFLEVGGPREALQLVQDGTPNCLSYEDAVRPHAATLFGHQIRRLYDARKFAAPGDPGAKIFKTMLACATGLLAEKQVRYVENVVEAPVSSLDYVISYETAEDYSEFTRIKYIPEDGSCGATLYKDGWARMLPWVQAAARVQVSKVVWAEVQAGAQIRRLYTDGFICDRPAQKLQRLGRQLGEFRLEKRGRVTVAGLSRVKWE